jgi:hypothetical protein
MLSIKLHDNDVLLEQIFGCQVSVTNTQIQVDTLEERVKLLIIRDLLRLNWEIHFGSQEISISPPEFYDKDTIKQSMSVKRMESLNQNRAWIDKHLELARKNLADGKDVIQSEILPSIEVCRTKKQHAIFRIFRYYWSSPYSEYVGRRIRLLIRDHFLPEKPIIGIAALGSSIIHIPERDDWVGWDKKTRTDNLIYTMDAYVLGALPPYNHLLGGKLISYIIASNEVRDIYKKKYHGKVTQIRKRTADDLACIFTTSLYGRSSQYNRIRYKGKLLYIPIGQTKGYGTLHLTDETFQAMRHLLESKNISVTNRFGDGPIWRMRVIRSVGDLLGFDSDFLLQHSFQRDIYAIPLAKNFKAYLNSDADELNYCDYPLVDLVDYWKKRWFEKRRKRPEIRERVLGFYAKDFGIF